MARSKDLVGEIRRMLEVETGEKTDRATAEIWLDRWCDAFVTTWEFEPEYAVRRDPEVARWLMWRWTGEDGRKLRKVIAEVLDGATD